MTSSCTTPAPSALLASTLPAGGGSADRRAYRIPNVEVGFEAIYTNTVPGFALQGLRPAAGVRRAGTGDGRPRRTSTRPHGAPPAELHLAGGVSLRARRPDFVDGPVSPSTAATTRRCSNHAHHHRLSQGSYAKQQEPTVRGRWLGFGLAAYVEATGPGPYEAARLDVDPAAGPSAARPAPRPRGSPIARPSPRSSPTSSASTPSRCGRHGRHRRLRRPGTFASRTAVIAETPST